MKNKNTTINWTGKIFFRKLSEFYFLTVDVDHNRGAHIEAQEVALATRKFDVIVVGRLVQRYALIDYQTAFFVEHPHPYSFLFFGSRNTQRLAVQEQPLLFDLFVALFTFRLQLLAHAGRLDFGFSYCFRLTTFRQMVFPLALMACILHVHSVVNNDSIKHIHYFNTLNAVVAAFGVHHILETAAY